MNSDSSSSSKAGRARRAAAARGLAHALQRGHGGPDAGHDRHAFAGRAGHEVLRAGSV